MQVSRIRKTILQWFLPIMVLVIMLVIFIMMFLKNSEKIIDNLLESYNEQVCYSYSESLKDSMQATMDIAVNAQNILQDRIGMNNVIVADLVDALINTKASYMTAYCYVNGHTLLSNEKSVQLENASYFNALQGTENYFIYTEDDEITGRAAFLYVCPVVRYSEVSGYLLTFISPEAFAELFEDSPFMQHAFFAIVDDEGRILSSYGHTASTQLLQDDFWGVMESYALTSGRWNVFKRQRDIGEKGSLVVSAGEEQRTVFLFPIEGTAWKLIAGVNDAYNDSARSEIWQPVTRLIVQIISAFTVYLIIVIGINLLFRIQASKSKRELEDKADTDLLTDLNNKMATERKIKEYMEAYPKSRSLLLIIDLDNFKKINDTLGHAFGDEVLRQTGMRLQSMFRVTDIIGRVGGDEFIVFLKDISDIEHIEREGRKLELFFRQFEVGEYVKYSINASIGGAIFSEDGETFEELYKAADSALYHSKKRGKNCLSFHHEIQKQ